MLNNLPIVSAIIPCRNEEKHIAKCLDSVVAQDYPKEKLEVLVVDGDSEDRTKEIVEGYVKKYSFTRAKRRVESKKISSSPSSLSLRESSVKNECSLTIRLLENPKKITPSAMNLGIKNSKGEIIVKMDAHARYEKDYISKCVRYLKESGADNVGGVLKTVPGKATLWAKSIAFCLSHPFGAGNSYFRIGSKTPKWVDTVAFGCYKREIFEKIGLFNEDMAKIEDLELNWRLRKAGGKILLAPDITAFYYPSSENILDFFWHNFTDGIWATYPLKFGIKISSPRHLIPLFFVLGLLGGFISALFFFWAKVIFVLIFGIYLLLDLFFSLKAAIKEDPRYLFSLPLTFFSRHFGYGLGSIWGLIKIII